MVNSALKWNMQLTNNVLRSFKEYKKQTDKKT